MCPLPPGIAVCALEHRHTGDNHRASMTPRRWGVRGERGASLAPSPTFPPSSISGLLADGLDGPARPALDQPERLMDGSHRPAVDDVLPRHADGGLGALDLDGVDGDRHLLRLDGLERIL